MNAKNNCSKERTNVIMVKFNKFVAGVDKFVKKNNEAATKIAELKKSVELSTG